MAPTRASPVSGRASSVSARRKYRASRRTSRISVVSGVVFVGSALSADALLNASTGIQRLANRLEAHQNHSALSQCENGRWTPEAEQALEHSCDQGQDSWKRRILKLRGNHLYLPYLRRRLDNRQTDNQVPVRIPNSSRSQRNYSTSQILESLREKRRRLLRKLRRKPNLELRRPDNNNYYPDLTRFIGDENHQPVPTRYIPPIAPAIFIAASESSGADGNLSGYETQIYKPPEEELNKHFGRLQALKKQRKDSAKYFKIQGRPPQTNDTSISCRPPPISARRIQLDQVRCTKSSLPQILREPLCIPDFDPRLFSPTATDYASRWDQAYLCNKVKPLLAGDIGLGNQQRSIAPPSRSREARSAQDICPLVQSNQNSQPPLTQPPFPSGIPSTPKFVSWDFDGNCRSSTKKAPSLKSILKPSCHPILSSPLPSLDSRRQKLYYIEAESRYFSDFATSKAAELSRREIELKQTHQARLDFEVPQEEYALQYSQRSSVGIANASHFLPSTPSVGQSPEASPVFSERPTSGHSFISAESPDVSKLSTDLSKISNPFLDPVDNDISDATRVADGTQLDSSKEHKTYSSSGLWSISNHLESPSQRQLGRSSCQPEVELVPASVGLGTAADASESHFARLSGSTLRSRADTWDSTQTVGDEVSSRANLHSDLPRLLTFADFRQYLLKGSLVQSPSGEYFDPNKEPTSIKSFVVTNRGILRYEEALKSRARVFILENSLRSSNHARRVRVPNTPDSSAQQQPVEQSVPRTARAEKFAEVNSLGEKEEEPPVIVHGVIVPRQRLLERRSNYTRPLSILTRLQIASPAKASLLPESPQSPSPPPLPRRSSKRPRPQALNCFGITASSTADNKTLLQNEKVLTEQELFEQNHRLLVSEVNAFPRIGKVHTEQELFEQNHQLLIVEESVRTIESEDTRTPAAELSFLTKRFNQASSRFASARQVDAIPDLTATSYSQLPYRSTPNPPTSPLTPYHVPSSSYERSAEKESFAQRPLPAPPNGQLGRSRAYSGKRENPLRARFHSPAVPSFQYNKNQASSTTPNLYHKPASFCQSPTTPHLRYKQKQISSETLSPYCKQSRFVPCPAAPYKKYSNSQTSSIVPSSKLISKSSAQTSIQPNEEVSFLGKSETMDSSRLSSRPEAVMAMMNDAKKMQLSVMEDCKKTGKVPPKYNLLQLIGKGSFGRVYKAKDMVTAQVVAVKTIDIDESDTLNPREANAYVDFLKEVNALTALSEIKARNINHVIEALPVGKSMWMITEYCAGGSVSTLMNPTRPGGLQEKWIIPILREVAEAIRWVHSVKIIHRDIKCGNILVTEEGGVQLCDFGIASILESKLEKRKTFIGTPNWMAPELFDNQVVYGQDIDIWAFGAMAYEIAYGLPPNAGIQFQQLGVKLKQSVPRLEGDNYSTELQNIVAYCLEPIPSARPAIEDVEKHPYIYGTSELYPTSSLTQLIKAYKIWEDHGGSRRSMMYPGGAAGPSDTEPGNGGAAEWNFSTTDDFGREVESSENAQDVFDAYGTAIDLDTSFAQSSSRPKGRRRPPPQIMGRNFRQPIEKVFDPHTFSNYDENSRAQYRNRQEPPSTSDLPLRNNDNETSIRDTMIDLGGHDVETGLSSFPDMDTIKAGRRDRDDTGDEYASSPQSFSRPALSDPEQLNNNRRTQDWKFPSMAPPASADPEISRFPSSYEVPRPSITPGSGARPTLVHHPTEPSAGLFGGLSLANNAAARDSAYSLMIDLDDAIRVPAPVDYSARPSTANSDVGSVTSEQASSRNPFEFERHASRIPQFDGPNDMPDPQIYVTGEKSDSGHSRNGSGARDLTEVSDFSASDAEGNPKNSDRFFSEASNSDYTSMPPPPRPDPSRAQTPNALLMIQFPDLPPPPSAAALSGIASDANMAMEFHRMIDGLSEQLHTFKHTYEQLKPITVSRRPSQRREAEDEPPSAAAS